MAVVFIVVFFLFFLCCVSSAYENYSQEKEAIKKEVDRDYKKLIDCCKVEPILLLWVQSLDARFEEFVKSPKSKLIKPYDKFFLKNPSDSLLSFIAVDKDKKLKLVINFEPSMYDEGRTDKYLKYCVSYDDGLKELIKKCKVEAENARLEKKRVETIEKFVNDKYGKHRN